MIISCINIKGGVGKTTSALAIATAAARDGLDVVVLDADPQASATLWADSAEGIGDPLPFDVNPANVASVRRMAGKAGDKVVVIDCPPSGNVVDEAARVSDFIVVPSRAGAADLTKTYETVETLAKGGMLHAILLTCVRPQTLAYKSALSELAEAGVSYFEHAIPLREDVSNFFGNAFGDDLYGYAEIYQDIKEAVNGD